MPSSRIHRWTMSCCALLIVTCTFSLGSTNSAVGAGTTKQTTKQTTKPATPVKSVTSTTKAVAVRKAREVVQPGSGLKGWSRRGVTDWPASDSAVVAVPIKNTILVRKTPDLSTPGLLLTARESTYGDLGLLVVGESTGWWKVLLPVRPNETIGWVQSGTVNLRVVHERITVDLATNRITLYIDGKVARSEDAATGTSGTPTPDGLYFVKSVIPQPNPDGGRGPYVLVLSAFSEVLNSFDGGQGAIGIHGTSAPGKIGQNVSHGCVRVTNETVTLFAELINPGVPVEIYQRSSDAPKARWTTPEAVRNGKQSSAPVAVVSGSAGSAGSPQDSTPGAAPNDSSPEPTTTLLKLGAPTTVPVTRVVTRATTTRTIRTVAKKTSSPAANSSLPKISTTKISTTKISTTKTAPTSLEISSTIPDSLPPEIPTA
jgi:L,D-transpeptidase catalytic domain